MTDHIKIPLRRSDFHAAGVRIALVGTVLGVAVSCSSSGPAVTKPGAAGVTAGAGAGGSASGSAAPRAPALPAAPQEPPAARQFAAWLAAFNAADRAALLAYHERSFPYAAASADVAGIDRELGLSRGTGGFELRKTEESTATRFSTILKEQNSDQHARATMEVDAAEPHRVVRFQIGPIPTPDDLRVQQMSEADAIAALRAELAKVVAKDRFSGAVLVAKNGVPIFAEAFGLADREKQLPNKLDTRFRIGSMNKMFTAVATLQLVQGKQLETGTTVGQVLRDYPNKGVASKVTVHHLLTHTGGTGDIFGPDFDAHRLELKTIGDYVKLYGNRDLEFEPVSKWGYSNYGFILLGAIIEKISKQSYYDRVSAKVFQPAGMTGTASPLEDRPDAARSVPYTKKTPDGPWTSAASTLPYRGTSAGGGDSTVGDLLRFANALTGSKLLDAAHTALLTTGKFDTTGGAKYAYGFEDGTEDGVRCFGHGGGAPGMNGSLKICDSGYTIVVLANLDPPAASRMARFIKRRLPAK